MIYHINFGIGWASSGVEYAQTYRANILRELQVDCRFVYLDFISSENIQTFTSNMGFKDNEVIWLYQYFTDIKIKPSSYNIKDLIDSISTKVIKSEQIGRVKKLILPGDNNYISCLMNGMNNTFVECAEFVSNGVLIRKDYYTYTKVFTEYYAPDEGVAKVYLRHFYNEDGSVAYKEYINGQESLYDFNNVKLYSKTQLIAHFINDLALTSRDMIIIDRSINVGQAILQNKGEAKVGVVIHADHFNPNFTSDQTILWNNFYDYVFTQAAHIDFFITATNKQKALLLHHFKHYKGISPEIFVIPVGSLDELKTSAIRKPYSIITASRLAPEKHVDIILKAVVKVHDTFPEITLDIYGEGSEKANLLKIIESTGSNDFITIKGHHDLKDKYSNYELFLSASQSEGFGLTLMEAVGAGLGLIGFDVNYGNPTFIKHDENGFLIRLNMEDIAKDELVDKYAQKIIDFYQQLDHETVQRVSYSIAESYLTESIKHKWEDLIEGVLYD